jgi:hypothetical protein
MYTLDLGAFRLTSLDDVAHPDRVSAFDVDAARNVETRRWLFAPAYARAAVVLCPHATAPGLGRLVRHGTDFVWVPLQQ